MTYNAMDVAKYIIRHCNSLERPISNLKLQKVMYFAWIDYYAQKKSYLFNEEFCAWKFGPVIPEVYYEYSIFAGNPITRDADTNMEENTLLDSIIDRYMGESVSSLVNRSHRPNGAWSEVFKEGEGIRQVIPFSLIVKKEVVESVNS